MLKNKYEELKKIYNDYLIIMKCGSFYLTLNDDALVLNKICNYKINHSTNFIKSGFPISIISKVEEILTKNSVNYIIVDQDISAKNKFKNNSYNDYLLNEKKKDFLIRRIDYINTILKNNIENKNIKNIISNIEDVLCEID